MTRRRSTRRHAVNNAYPAEVLEDRRLLTSVEIYDQYNLVNSVEIDGDIYFTAVDSGQEMLLRGDESGIEQLANLADATNVGALNGDPIFTHSTGETGRELFRWNGSSIELISDTNPGPDGAFFGQTYALGSKALFWRDLGELWVTDGTDDGTFQLADVALGSSEFVVAGDLAYFKADDGVHGMEIWRTDGTVAGTKIVANFSRDNVNEHTYEFKGATENGVFVTMDSSSTSQGAWYLRNDGSRTRLTRSYVEDVTEFNGDIFWTGVDGDLFVARNNGDSPEQLLFANPYSAARAGSIVGSVNGRLVFTVPEFDQFDGDNSDLIQLNLHSTDGQTVDLVDDNARLLKRVSNGQYAIPAPVTAEFAGEILYQDYDGAFHATDGLNTRVVGSTGNTFRFSDPVWNGTPATNGQNLWVVSEGVVYQFDGDTLEPITDLGDRLVDDLLATDSGLFAGSLTQTFRVLSDETLPEPTFTTAPGTIPGGNPVLRWNAVEGADFYEFDGSISGSTRNSAIILRRFGPQVIRVRTVSGNQRSEWTEIDVFARPKPDVAGPPRLIGGIADVDGQSANSVRFSAEDVFVSNVPEGRSSGSDRHIFIQILDAETQSLVYQGTPNSGVFNNVGNSFSRELPLRTLGGSSVFVPGRTYSWRTYAKAWGTRSEWTDFQEFTVVSENRVKLFSPLDEGQLPARPTLRWTRFLGTGENHEDARTDWPTTYQLQIVNRSTGETEVLAYDLTETSYRPENDLPPGDYRAWVLPYNNGQRVFCDGKACWSAGLDFSIGMSVTGLSPDGLENSTRPTFNWDDNSGEPTWELWVNGESGRVIHERYLSTNSFQPANNLAEGDYEYWVRAHYPNGVTSRWSNGVEFTVDTQTPQITGPVNLTGDTTPTFTWDGPSNVSNWKLHVRNLDTGENTVIEPENITSREYTHSVPFSRDSVPFSRGRYQVWVRGYNGTQVATDWSPGARFSIGEEIQITGPTTVREYTVQYEHNTGRGEYFEFNDISFSWNSVTDAVRYEVEFRNMNLGETILKEEVTGPSFDVGYTLPAGNYRTWVRAIFADGRRARWSDAFDLEVI